MYSVGLQTSIAYGVLNELNDARRAEREGQRQKRQRTRQLLKPGAPIQLVTRRQPLFTDALAHSTTDQYSYNFRYLGRISLVLL